MIIAICISKGRFGKAFFFRQAKVFWLPFKDCDSDYLLYDHTENLTTEKWLGVSAGVLTQWSEE